MTSVGVVTSRQQVEDVDLAEHRSQPSRDLRRRRVPLERVERRELFERRVGQEHAREDPPELGIGGAPADLDQAQQHLGLVAL